MSKVGVPLIKVFIKNSEEANEGVTDITNGDRMWIMHSNHYSIRDAKKIVNQLITRYGSDHVMMCQVLDLEGNINII